MPRLRHIPLLLAAAAAWAASAADAQQVRPGPRLVPGSKARQLLLKKALEKHLSGALVAELNRNKKQWLALSPEQRNELRQRAIAFLRANPDRQADLIRAAWDYQRLSERQKQLYRERAKWLARVVARLTPAQRERLKALPPAQRAKRLLELKAALPATRPADQPTTRPAAGGKMPATAPAE